MQPPKLKLLLIISLFIFGSLAVIPAYQSIAQSCNTGEITHVIASGENLFRIGLRYGVPFEAIATRNGISDVTRIFAGTTLCIPAGGTIPSTTGQTIVQIIVITATPSSTTTQTTTTNTTTTVTVAPGEENWCLNGGPWDDGRCIVPGDPFLQDYWFLAGWCNAQVELGNYMGSVDDCLNGIGGMRDSMTTSTAFNFDLVDSDAEFACTIIFDKDTGVVTSLARWDEAYDEQGQVIFFTNLPDLANYAVNLDEDDTQAGTTGLTLPHKTFSHASAKIQQRDSEGMETGSIGSIDCARIEV